MNINTTVAIVTGGASGLGEACVRALVALGAKVGILDMAADAGEKLAAEMTNMTVFVRTDVCSDESVKSAIQKVIEAFGRLDVTVNCAGIADPGRVLSKKGPMSLSSFNRVLQVNLVGTFNVIRLSIEQMVKNEAHEDGEKGVIVNTASVAAFDGQIGQSAYSASKAGVAGMTLPLARECSEYGIRVVTIAPGLFATPMLAGLPKDAQDSLGKMVPFPKRLGKPAEYAALVRHIIENTMLNGEVIRLDGAIRMAAK